MPLVTKSRKLFDVGYDIRGPVLERAQKMEADGIQVMKLNIGNIAAFGIEPPADMVEDIIRDLPKFAGYTDSKGLVASREAVMRYAEEKGISGVSVEDIYLGNGASELIAMSLNALLDEGDEVLVPAPDYPLWTAAVSLSGGTPRHYLCDEQAGWMPDLEDIARKVTARTKAIVVINPNNPTGALYPPQVLRNIVEIARRHRLIVFADEIYDRTLYDGNTHTSIASLTTDVLFVTLNGLSKNYRACGYRAGWMIVSGDTATASDYIEGLNMLASMRLCANTPGQLAVRSALTHSESDIRDLVRPGGRLAQQRDLAYDLLAAIPGVSVVKPRAALYMFPRLDREMYPISDDQQFASDLLGEEKVLIVQGTGFNWVAPDHFRVVFLPNAEDLAEAVHRIARFLDRYRARR